MEDPQLARIAQEKDQIRTMVSWFLFVMILLGFIIYWLTGGSYWYAVVWSLSGAYIVYNVIKNEDPTKDRMLIIVEFLVAFLIVFVGLGGIPWIIQAFKLAIGR